VRSEQTRTTLTLTIGHHAVFETWSLLWILLLVLSMQLKEFKDTILKILQSRFLRKLIAMDVSWSSIGYFTYFLDGYLNYQYITHEKREPFHQQKETRISGT
jgi:hypothetical protein